MNLSTLSIQTTFSKSASIELNDEKAQIMKDRSPVKTRPEASPLPKIDHPQNQPKFKEEIEKQIIEYRTLGSGKIDLLSCRFDPEDCFIAACTSDGIVNVYNLLTNTDKPALTVNGADTLGMPVTCLRWKPFSSRGQNPQILMSSCVDGNVSQWHVPTGKLLSRVMEKDNEVLAIDYSMNGTYFATAGKDRTIRVYDSQSNSKITELTAGYGQSEGHSNRILALKFNPSDPHLIVSGGWDHSLYFWDIRQEKSLAKLQGPTISGDAIDVKKNLLLTGSWRTSDQLEIWDFGTRKKITSINWGNDQDTTSAYIYSCQFSKFNDESIVAGCSNLNEVRIFDRTKENKYFGKISDLTKGVYSVDYANNSDMFSFCGGEGRIHIIQINKSSVLTSKFQDTP